MSHAAHRQAYVSKKKEGRKVEKLKDTCAHAYVNDSVQHGRTKSLSHVSTIYSV